jgi:hypothetical protein
MEFGLHKSCDGGFCLTGDALAKAPTRKKLAKLDYTAPWLTYKGRPACPGRVLEPEL